MGGQSEDRTNAERQRRWRDRQRGGPPRVPAGHGTTGSYRRGCRCGDCRGAWAAYIKARRQATKKPRSTG